MTTTPSHTTGTPPVTAADVPVTTVRYFAAAAEAAGVDTEQVPVPVGATVGTLLDALAARHGTALQDVAARCALLVDGVLHRDRDEPLGTPSRVDVLPPFAGG